MAGGRDGRHGGRCRTLVGAAWFLSALLGGVVNITAVVVFAVILWVSKPASAGATVAAMFRAEAGKILVILAQLGLVLAMYRDIVPVVFFASFVITVMLFRMSLLEHG